MAEGIQQHRLQRHIEAAHGGLNRDRGRVMAGMFRQIKEQNSLRHWVRTLQHTKWREHGSIKLFAVAAADGSCKISGPISNGTIRGTYVHVNAKHLNPYLDEQAYRY